MTLPMLVGSSDCGPVNPLQGLSNSFDQDKGVRQDQFGPARPGSSRDTFRTQQSFRPLDKDAAAFFASTGHAGPFPFDMKDLNTVLPAVTSDPGASSAQTSQTASLGSWAADFMQHQSQLGASVMKGFRSTSPVPEAIFRPQSQGHPMFWASHVHNSLQPVYASPNPLMSNGVPYQPQKMNVNVTPDPSLWDQVILPGEKETSYASETSVVAGQEIKRENISHDSVDADGLSRTAALLVDKLRDEQNPKFKNSEFMGLMRSLRDKKLVVEGNQIVAVNESVRTGEFSREFVGLDIKGKGRAVEDFQPRNLQIPFGANHDHVAFASSSYLQDGSLVGERSGSSLHSKDEQRDAEASSSSVDEVYEYFRQENEEYIQYHNEQYEEQPQAFGARDHNVAEWDKLQDDWDAFEATSAGIKPLGYQFTPNNPYLLGERSGKTLDHMRHSFAPYEQSVLELEAQAQRDPTNAHVWFALGIKQQDSEREAKAIDALRRSVELDPTYMPSWLALGISHTNDSNRQGAYTTIREWVERHERYESLSQKLSSLSTSASFTLMERYEELISCLITMARSDISGNVDADIQVALAVLLNSIEEFGKATDCFLAALAVRPHDWVLYNRVGATLANNGSAEQALEYYYRALELNPMYIRARFNVGISCINLHRYDEAARHILDALTLQDSDTVGGEKQGGVTSSVLWNCLRTVCIHMDRMDLALMCESQDLEALRSQFNS